MPDLAGAPFGLHGPAGSAGGSDGLRKRIGRLSGAAGRRGAASNNRRIVQQWPCALRGLADGPRSWPGRAYMVKRKSLTGSRAPCGCSGAAVAGCRTGLARRARFVR